MFAAALGLDDKDEIVIRPWHKPLPDGWLTLCGEFPPLNPAQQAFLDSDAPWTGYGGSPNCGKTVAMICAIVRDGMTKPGNRGALIRKELSAAERGVVEDLKEYIVELNKEFGFGIEFKDDASTPRVVFPTGAKCFIFGGKDISRVQGANFADIYIEEATQLNQEQIGMINRTRRGKTFTRIERLAAVRCRIWWVSNACEGWFKDTIVDPSEEGRLEEAGWEPGECVFIRGRLADNAVNLEVNKRGGNDFLKNLKRDYGVEEALRMADGNWSLGAGNVWRPLVTTGPNRDVISMLDFMRTFGRVTEDDQCYFGLDHGINHPSTIVLGVFRQLDAKRYLIIFSEWSEALGDRPHSFLSDTVARMMLPCVNYEGWAESKMKHGNAQMQQSPEFSPMVQLWQAGLNVTPAPCCKPNQKALSIHSVMEALGSRSILFVEEGTKKLRQQWAGYKRAGEKREIGMDACLPAKDAKNDHILDAFRYLISGLVQRGLIEFSGSPTAVLPEELSGPQTAMEMLKERTGHALAAQQHRAPVDMRAARQYELSGRMPEPQSVGMPFVGDSLRRDW